MKKANRVPMDTMLARMSREVKKAMIPAPHSLTQNSIRLRKLVETQWPWAPSLSCSSHQVEDRFHQILIF